MTNKKQNYFTNHATKRCQQRGIPQEVVHFIIEHGETVYTHSNKKHYLKRGMFKYLRNDYPSFFSKYDKQLEKTAVISSENTIITVMKIQQKLRIN